MKHIFILLIKLYQKIKPKSWNGSCIYKPSCSNYAIIAFNKYGVLRGLSLTYNRIKRCDHKHAGGVDLP